MKKNILNYIAAVVLLGGVSSCQKDFTRMNKNPNNLETPDPTTLLSNTIVSEFYNNANLAWTLGNGYNQYMSFSTDYYNTPTRYLAVSNQPYWTALYEAARDANTLYQTGIADKNPLLQAASLTLRSYAFAQLTELWGDIPFSKALNGANGIFTAPYDKQQTVYTDPTLGVLPSLKRADSLLSANPSANQLAGDLLFKSNAMSWRKFINALRLRYLLRVSGKMDVSGELQSIVSSGALMQSASESAVLNLPTTIPYNFPSLTERTGDFQVKYMNSLLYNSFVSTGDSSRIQAYFAKNANSASTTGFDFSYYGGLPIVVNANSSQTSTSSDFNPAFVSGTNGNLTIAKVMTYAEQEFILAEAAMKGYITTGTALTYYNNGIMGAFAQLGLSSATAANYLLHPNIILNEASTSTAMQQIITQKWLANINNGFEGWLEYRRTGYPALQTGGTANMNNGKIPNRFIYPTDETQINSTNYTAEVNANMGGKENTDYKAWW